MLCITSFLFLSIGLRAQDLKQTLSFADAQREMGNHDVAAKAYKRIIFFQTEEFRENVFARLADTYLDIAEFKNAAKYYDLAYAYERNDSLKNEFTLKKSFCRLVEQEYSYALLELFSLEDNLPEEQQNRKNFYLGISYFGTGDFENSETYFQKCLAEEDKKAELSKLFEKNAKIRINPKTAKTLSIILPGLGQFYAGDIKNGLNSMILTGGLIALGIYSATQFTIFDAAISILPWYQRYYVGGFKKAEIIAQNKLDKKRNAIYKQIINIIANQAENN